MTRGKFEEYVVPVAENDATNRTTASALPSRKRWTGYRGYGSPMVEYPEIRTGTGTDTRYSVVALARALSHPADVSHSRTTDCQRSRGIRKKPC